MREGQMSDEHKNAIAQGRTEGKTVRAYLEALKAGRPKRGRKVTAESVNARIATIDSELDGADPVRQLHLTQERLNLVSKLEAFGEVIDVGAVEAEFVKVAASYSARTGVSYAAWRQVGVDAAVLKKAGITR